MEPGSPPYTLYINTSFLTFEKFDTHSSFAKTAGPLLVFRDLLTKSDFNAVKIELNGKTRLDRRLAAT